MKYLLAFMLIALPALAAEPNMPDPALTPGVARDLTVDQICKTRWGKDHRAVTAAMKKQVFASYGYAGNNDPKCMPPAGTKSSQHCEIDHLVSRELGGADDVKNLWPQSYWGPYNAHHKDRLENRLHKEVCTNGLSLEDARAQVKDWKNSYVKYFGEPK